MSDYIKREDAIKAMDTWDKFGCDGHGRLVPYTEEYVPYVKFDDMMKAVEGQPSADVAPVRHGRWIDTDRYGFPVMECSECGTQTGTLNFPYCFNCGARMDDEND